MIRTVELSLKFTNKTKRNKICNFIEQYRLAMNFFIDELWDSNEYKFVSKNILDKCQIDITARAKQCSGKQVLSIIHGTAKKHKQRIYVRNQLIQKNLDTKKLDKLINNGVSKPKIDKIPIELDSRFFQIEKDTNSFDLWVKLSLGGKSIKIPLKKTKLFNKWSKTGKLKLSCRLSEDSIWLFFECEPIENESKKQLGIDIGINSVFSTSDGSQVIKCPHGHSLNSICKKLSRKKRGSKSFKRAIKHRKNFICWSVNQLNLSSCQEIVIEDIKNMRKGKRISRFLQHFTYDEIFRRIELKCEELNVLVSKVSPVYTSQKCSHCGEIETKNRKGESFICLKCGYSSNADINAAQNILTSL